MIKVAIFAEGQTEQLFVCEVIQQLASNANFYVASHRKNGKGERLIKIDVDSIGDPNVHDIYFQVLNCDSDNQVLSTIREEYDTLLQAGFTHIIGVRDLYPRDISALGRLLTNIEKLLPQGEVTPLLVMAIMEVEAWFLAENTHFLRIDPSLSVESILEQSGIDITVDSQGFAKPSETLAEIYDLAHKTYDKSKASLTMTMNALDVGEFKGPAGQRATTVLPLITRIQEIFAMA